jgi:hypothetical protein
MVDSSMDSVFGGMRGADEVEVTRAAKSHTWRRERK